MGVSRVVPVLLGLLPLATAVHAAEPPWSFAASAYGYLVPAESDYVQPSGMADRGPVHFEARYNYEDLETGSVWAGWNLAGGGEVTFELTPMLGGVFGATAGVAPGYRGSLGWRRIELSSEGEYLIDSRDRDDSFFYTWSELAFRSAGGMRAGLALQRTRAYESPREIQRGIVVGLLVGRAEIAAYLFNPDDDKPLGVLAITAEL